MARHTFKNSRLKSDKPSCANIKARNCDKQKIPIPFSKPFLALAIVTLLSENSALANPEGGKVVAGSANIIQKSPGQLDIIQNSNKAVIDWRGFSIARGEQTRFLQPSSSSIALNRVRVGQASIIDGALSANGNVWLINPNGVLFGKGAQVNVGSLMATTSDIDNDNFMAGHFVFDEATDNLQASIVNQGHIEVSDGGSIVLAAPRVSNEGLIKARLGHVVLASGDTFTMDFHGDGMLQFDIGEPVQQPINNGATGALVSNQGRITVDGGIVEMTAKTRNSMVERVINMEGVIQARAVDVKGGTIILSGGETGIVAVSGTLDVSGKESDQVGGVVKVLGEKVGLFDGAELDASGDVGGGQVLVGGNFQGKGPEPNARRVLITEEATIKADALSEGDGGKAIVWSDEVTGFHGTINASAGENTGDGGLVEVSGKQLLVFTGSVDTSSERGRDGSVLLDPENIRIVETGGQNNAEISDGAWLFQDAPTSGDSTVEAAAVEAVLGDIIFQATENIAVDAALNLENQTEGERVVFQAGNDISINADIQSAGADLFIEADSPFADPNADGSNSFGTVSVGEVTVNGFDNMYLIGANFEISSSAEFNSRAVYISPTSDSPLIIGSGILNATELDTITSNIAVIGSAWTAGEDGLSLVRPSIFGNVIASSILVDVPVNFINTGWGWFVSDSINVNAQIDAPRLNFSFFEKLFTWRRSKVKCF